MVDPFGLENVDSGYIWPLTNQMSKLSSLIKTGTGRKWFEVHLNAYILLNHLTHKTWLVFY